MSNIPFNSSLKRKVPFVEQMQQSECGLCCLAMILRYYDYHIDLPELRSHAEEGRNGTSLLAIKRLAERYHIKATGHRTDVESLSTLTLPAILFWNHKHYVILEQIKGQTAMIVDPEAGKIRLSLDQLKNHYSGIAMSFLPTEQFQTKKVSRQKYYAFFHTFLNQKKLIYQILFWSMIIQCIAISIPMLLKYIIDHVIKSPQTSFVHLIGVSGILMMFLYFSFNWLHGQLLIRLQNKLDHSLMHRFINHLFSLPYSFFQLRSSGDLIMRTNSNIAIRQIISNQLISTLINVLLIIVLAAYMFTQSLLLASIVLCIAVVQILVVLVTRTRLRYLTQAEVSAQTQTSGYLTEAVQGISVIKSLGVEEGTYQGWNRHFNHQLECTRRKLTFQNNLTSIQSSLLFIAPLLVTWVGATLVLQGHITLGTLFAFQSLVITFLTPFNSLAVSFSEMIKINALVERIRDILDTSTEDSSNHHSVTHLKGNIKVNQLYFWYDSKRPILKNIHLDIKAGQKVAIVGQSGSGKSTLASLLSGLNTPRSGTIYYDHFNLVELNKSSLRQHIGMVMQEDLLFNRSILENIRMYHDHVSQQDIVYACQLANIHDDIIKMPMGYETMVSEMGSNLSGGQKQRIIMARALARRPEVLILDEATSALDTITEHHISQHLDELSCTQIIIAHRMSTIKSADHIILLKHGEIEAQGTHAYLLATSNEYRAFYEQKEKEHPYTDAQSSQ